MHGTELGSEFLRWFNAAFLVFMGTAWLVTPWRIGAVCPLVPTRGLPDVDAERLSDAGCRRKEIENISPWFGRCLGAADLVFAIGCAAGFAPPGLWYAIALLTNAVVMGAAFLRLRATTGRRLAVLRARSPISVVPWYWFAAGAGVSLLALGSNGFDLRAWPALVAGVAGLASTWLAWCLASTPALLVGEDVSAERFVDDHVRFGRATSVLLLAFCEIFVFVLDEYAVGSGGIGGLDAMAVSAVWLVFSVWTVMRKCWPRRLVLS